jgi:thiaminase/transcriptional activator TenA
MQHARESVQAEMSLHKSVLEDYGISKEKQAQMEPAPEAFGYMSYLVATAHSRPFEESIAALLPCYWIYWEVGKELLEKGSRDPHYQKWIDNYASEGYGETVKAVMAIANESARKTDEKTLAKMKEHFRRASRYEWMFWDSAYALRRWPPP